MTTMAVRPVGDVSTPESQCLTRLREMLDDPTYQGWREQIHAEIVRLTATVLEA